jgi:Cu/Ag efflux protein CusF
MRICKLLMTSAVCAGFLASAYGSPLQTSAAPLAQQTAQDKQDNMKKELLATVVSVDPQQKTIKIEEIGSPIAVTSNTAFDDDVQLDKLKAGTKVKLVLNATPDGKFEAAEVRAVK